jgi:hypothetical protein
VASVDLSGKSSAYSLVQTSRGSVGEVERYVGTDRIGIVSGRVSNFSVENLELLLKSADIVPAVNQVSGANSFLILIDDMALFD